MNFRQWEVFSRLIVRNNVFRSICRTTATYGTINEQITVVERDILPRKEDALFDEYSDHDPLWQPFHPCRIRRSISSFVGESFSDLRENHSPTKKKIVNGRVSLGVISQGEILRLISKKHALIKIKKNSLILLQ